MSALKIKTKCQNVEIEIRNWKISWNYHSKNYHYIISGARCGWIRWLRARWWFFLRNYQPFELPRFYASKWYRTFSDLKKRHKNLVKSWRPNSPLNLFVNTCEEDGDFSLEITNYLTKVIISDFQKKRLKNLVKS